ncbi:head GIN domain-containing protein [Roseivirga sp.]|uniref:head GIN domain-containing protein n=1 Tax=Roseivirga sp. TaxID=1964215 RepID=UPI002B26D606|nr:head GIN domain-containing protein [Roseivirga sp.]
MKQQHLLLMPFAILALSGCSLDDITGNGLIITESRVVDDFHSVKLQIDADVYLLQDDEQTLRIETYENLMAIVDTYVSNGELIIKSNHNIRKARRLKVYISAPDFQNITLTGSGDINSENCMDLDHLNLKISGSGKIDICGTVDSLTASISGSGDINSYGLNAKVVDVNLSGSGKIKVTAIDNLAIRISGSGDVYYKGDPLVDSKISGSGRVIRTY